MFKKVLISGLMILALFACTKSQLENSPLPEVPEGAQAVSLRGEPLYPTPPSEETLAKLRQAEADYQADPKNADNIIWYGRRKAYAGDYRRAILIYTEGIRLYPEDARFYRHRGHRYISIREFDRAIKDLEKAASLIEGTVDQIEPDGLPNARNIPVSTLHTNIWYHLGLAYYLKNDLRNALRAYQQGIKASTNDDMLVATTHWLYMTLRRLGQAEEAAAVLEPIHPEMDIIENQAYYRLCLFYKGLLNIEELAGENFSDIMNDALAYGLGNWYLYNGQHEKAYQIYQEIIDRGIWASFGYIAAEADLVREWGEE